MKRLLCLISAVLLFPGVTFAQNATISGRLQHEDNDPVFACVVYGTLFRVRSEGSIRYTSF